MKKVTLILAALALVLGISQCKKQEEPAQNGEKQHIVLTANNGNDGSKVDVSSLANKLNLTWESTDGITVSGAMEGTLKFAEELGSGKAKFEGTVTRMTGEEVVFSLGQPDDYMGQDGTLTGLNGLIHLQGTSPYREDGKYDVRMILQNAVLKLDLSAFGPAEGTTTVTINVGEDPVASVTGITSASKEVYVAMLAAENTTYTFTGNGLTATKSWTLNPNTFYTADNEGAAIKIDAVPSQEIEFIDLGLPSGKLWADRNVGASAEYEVGDYYAWGETELWYTSISNNIVAMKSEYNQFNWDTYSAQSNMKSILSNLTGDYAIYDVARLLYGNDCHIPSDNEYWELANNCYWRYVDSYHGHSVEGYMIFKAKADADKGKYTLKNPTYTPVATYSESDTHIFLPYSGFITKKTVRSGNIDNGNAGKNAAYYLTSTTGQVALTEPHAGEAGYERFAIGVSKPTIATVPRHAGMPVRAVKQQHKTIEYVEIGGLKWATMNLGATKPEEPGLYFAWGDVAGQYAATAGSGAFSKSYEWSTIPFNNGSANCNSTYFNANKSLWLTDNTLKPEYDAASVLIGDGWRMPTRADFNVFFNETKRDRVTDYNGSGVGGWICTSKTDPTKSIFLPATGWGNGKDLSAPTLGYYYTSSLCTTNVGNAWRITLGEGSGEGNNARWQGRCIRPVHD